MPSPDWSTIPNRPDLVTMRRSNIEALARDLNVPYCPGAPKDALIDVLSAMHDYARVTVQIKRIIG